MIPLSRGTPARSRPSGASRALGALAVAAAVTLIAAVGATAQAPALVNVLLFHGGATNASVDEGIAAIEELGGANEFQVDPTGDPADLNATNLSGYRAVVVLHSSGDVLNATQVAALQGFVQAGGGFVGIGEAANLQPGSSFITNLIGARPAPGSSDQVAEQVVAVGDRVHPATGGLPLELTRSDVWYEWQSRPTGEVHTLARYHAPAAPAGDGTATGGTDWPISWCRDFQGGRSFYTGMGRTEGSYSEDALRDHLLGAVQWASGMLRAGCKATINSNYESTRLVNGVGGGLDNSGESHGLAVAPNGWVIYIGRGDCRTDAERGARFGGAPTGRILDFANPNVGVGCGTVHVWDPGAYNGTVNSGVTRAGTLSVYGDRGSGAEINGKIEAGLLGITLAPDFMDTGHIYLQYFPNFNPANPVHAGLADGDQRRITKMNRARVSRFTLDLGTKQLDLDSEVTIFEYDSQIYSCCHRGGGMGFDSDGNLYVTTGDSNSSQSTNGYSGNYQPARCPTGDPSEASNNHCGDNNISYNDARRTAGSSNDYNGKMLRLNPIDGIGDDGEPIPDGDQPPVGAGTTYEIPGAGAPNGPNLFSGEEGDGNQAKPEIYAMGLRNPSRLAIDPETDVPYSAWVGPDAGAPSVTQGPSTYESAGQIAGAGNYGWPYCMGNQQAYRDRVADGSLRTTNAPGYVSGGPAGSPTQGWYDCTDLVNDSTNNTGLTTLPHETGTGGDAGTARPVNIWFSRGNPGGNNGCPDFPREQGPDGAPNYGATPVQLCPYTIAAGATVFTGPVYRFDEEADDASARWPDYWDGRWFLHDFGGNSVRHALLLDPETAAGGGQPIYADNLKQIATWQGGAYMDSKFGPDGALYLQTYDGFFTVGNNVGLTRIAYTGGPDTPNPDPQWAAAGEGQIQFSIGRSGGVAYEWDFGDGSPTSDEANPVHTYEGTGTFEATLTVTYADGEQLTGTAEVNVSEDQDAPTTSVTLNGADPVETYDGPVDVQLSATDGVGGTGVQRSEYRVDGGAWNESENTGEVDPFVTEFTVSGDGEHTVEFRSRDRAGNLEEAATVTFTIEGGSGGGSCLPQSDEFDGDGLDAKWDVLRPTGDVQVADGRLTIPINQGDFIANDPLASDALLQDAPSGEWTVTAKLDTSEIDANGEQAGLVIWKSESPNTFSKVVAIQANSGAHQFEHIVTQSGSVDPPIPQSITPAPGGQLPDQVLMRARFDGSQVIGEFSADDGASWTLVGQAGHAAPFEAPLRIGLTAFRGTSGGGQAHFDWFRVHAGADPGQDPACAGGGSCHPLSDPFDGTELDPKWDLVNPVAGAEPTVGDGHLTLPVIPGDLFGGNGSAQLLLQQAPEDSWVTTAKIAHANIDTNGEAAGLALINSFNPNHFVKTAVQYKSDTDPDTAGDQPGKWAERVLTSDGNAITIPPETVPWPNSGALDLGGDYVWVRFVHDADAQEITTWTSTNGTSFVQFGLPMAVDEYLSQPGGLRVGLFAKHDGSGDDEVDVDAFNFVAGTADPQTPGDACGGPVEGDQTPPTTTHALNPAEPDGEGGWYRSPVEVTLEATDNEGGSGVDFTEYRFAGEEEWTPYEGAFTVGDEGRHTIQYRSTDLEGNAESPKSLSARIDPNAPLTTALINGSPPASNYDGPVDLTLEADDGAGSGVELTEVRVDGGEWQPYVEEETILGSQQDLERWAQAGPGGLNWVEVDEGDVTDTVVAVTASGENPPNEVKENLVDGSPGTKWLVFEPTGWVEFELSEPVAVARYALTSANDAPARDPMDWTLQGSDDGETWTELDQRSGQDFPQRFQSKVYEFENETAYGHYRLEITANNGAAGILQLAEVLLSDGTGSLDSGFARTQGGLGMPWYPVKDYGDFSLKMQWRDSGSGSNGNSGVFVRFPHPDETVALPPAERYPCQVGNAQSSPAWVAIFCGHEIQINDHQDSEPQKTGSLYNFSTLNAEQAQVQPKGTWVDYEIRVEGQTYTMLRNGEVINEFENSPGQQSSRPGDPPTDDRQFSRGYIGLQNHGGSDVIDFRDVRVLPLDEGSVRGPISIEGEGEHQVEFRSTDVAGNEEETRSVEFTIGEGAPERHEVFAQDNFWVPDQVDASVGDTVRWWFDPDAAGNPLELDPVFAPHDLWLDVNRTPEDFGDDAQLSEIVSAGSPESEVPVDFSFEEAGDYRFYCQIHLGTMQGQVSVSDEAPADEDPPVTTALLDGAEPVGSYGGPVDVSLSASDGVDESASGVDYTEHRIDGGEWVRSENGEGAEPFSTEFTVSAPGAHELEYRSADVAGNEEEIRAQAFTIESPPGITPRLPQLRALARPRVRKAGPGQDVVRFFVRLRNQGNGLAPRVTVCARAPKRRLKVRGGPCRVVRGLEPGASRRVAFRFRIRPPARGKVTRIRFIVRGPGIPRQLRVVRLRAKR